MSKRKHNIKDIGLQIDRITPFVNLEPVMATKSGETIEPHVGFTIAWSSKIGFGEYSIYRKALAYDKDYYTGEECPDEEWFGDSEYMDNGKDKEFLSELMRLFVEKITII